MMEEHLRPASCRSTWASAYHLELYEALFDAALRVGWRPRALLLPINLRGFCPLWWGDPATEPPDHARVISAFPKRRLRVRVVPPTLEAIERQLDRPLGSPMLPGWTVRDVVAFRSAEPGDEAGRRERHRVLFIAHFGVPIGPDHPRMASLRRIEARAAEVGVRLVTYVTPVNAEAARDHAGDELLDIIRENTRLTGGLPLATSLGPEHFFHATSLTEHLNQSGRSSVVSWVGDHVKDVLER